MKDPTRFTRRAILGRVAMGLSLGSLAMPPRARAAAPPLLQESDPAAHAVHYVADASKSKEAASSGANCSNCSLYNPADATTGGCTLFKGKRVEAAGWCNAWSGL
jgi:high potential iron-sulfur protein